MRRRSRQRLGIAVHCSEWSARPLRFGALADSETRTELMIECGKSMPTCVPIGPSHAVYLEAFEVARSWGGDTSRASRCTCADPSCLSDAFTQRLMGYPITSTSITCFVDAAHRARAELASSEAGPASKAANPALATPLIDDEQCPAPLAIDTSAKPCIVVDGRNSSAKVPSTARICFGNVRSSLPHRPIAIDGPSSPSKQRCRVQQHQLALVTD